MRVRPLKLFVVILSHPTWLVILLSFRAVRVLPADLESPVNDSNAIRKLWRAFVRLSPFGERWRNTFVDLSKQDRRTQAGPEKTAWNCRLLQKVCLNLCRFKQTNKQITKSRMLDDVDNMWSPYQMLFIWTNSDQRIPKKGSYFESVIWAPIDSDTQWRVYRVAVFWSLNACKLAS